MAEAVLEKAVCVACGVDVREGTQFCYNCGKPVTNGNLPPEPSEMVDGLAEETDALVSEPNAEQDGKIETESKTEKLAAAASERKRSRVGQRKPKTVVWEEPSPASNRIFVLFCILIAVISAALVFLMVFVK